ncbi:hypothetical protein BDR26DRAFT_1013591 [Obelidium mucronatum]|nr:hypothetical protein BDR26DRAFT_1013591 [Obelidium mucronatum]
MPPKKTTKVRPTSKSGNSSSASAKRENLLKWFKDQKIAFNPNLVSINVNESEEFNVTAKALLKTDTIIGSIPKVSCLSAKSSAIADLIDQEDLVGTLALTLALLFEQIHNKKTPSPWKPYLDSLPPKAPTPLFWTQPDLDLLSPTDTPYKEYKDSLYSDFTEIILPFARANPELFPSNIDDNEYWSMFQEASSLVTSRAFAIDAYHGDALVPLADLFNHKSGAEHVHIEGEGDVCVFCGAVEGGCDCIWSDDEGEDGHEHDPHGNCCGNEDHEGGEGDNGEDDGNDMTEEELSGLSIKELKIILNQIGVDSSDCLYKKDLVAKVIESYNVAKSEGKKEKGGDADKEDWEDEEDEDAEDESWLFNIEEPVPELVDTKAGSKKTKGGNNSSSQQKSHEQESHDQEVEDALDITILLNLYGFAELNNPNNNVKVNVEFLLETLRDVVGDKVLLERTGFWREVGRKIVDFALHGEDDDENDDDWESDDESDDHEHGDDCAHDHDGKKDPKDYLKDNDVFHFKNDGEASMELIAFLHLVLLDSKAFQTFTKDESAVKKYITHIVENGLETWIATPKTKKGKAQPVKATEKPIFHQIHAILNSAASQRLSSYDGTDGVEELKKLEELTSVGDSSPIRWALTVRTEERRILNAALEKYRQ